MGDFGLLELRLKFDALNTREKNNTRRDDDTTKRVIK